MDTILHSLTMAIYGDHALTSMQATVTVVLGFIVTAMNLAATINISTNRKIAILKEKNVEFPEGSVPAPNAAQVAAATVAGILLMLAIFYVAATHDSFYKDVRYSDIAAVYNAKEIPLRVLEQRSRETSHSEWGDWKIISVRINDE